MIRWQMDMPSGLWTSMATATTRSLPAIVGKIIVYHCMISIDDKQTWINRVIDRDIAAQDLRGGDLNGDGTPDVVAVGGATHNVVWYRFRRK